VINIIPKFYNIFYKDQNLKEQNYKDSQMNSIGQKPPPSHHFLPTPHYSYKWPKIPF